MVWKSDAFHKRWIFLLLITTVLIVVKWTMINFLWSEKEVSLHSAKTEIQMTSPASQEAVNNKNIEQASEVAANEEMAGHYKTYEVVATGYYAGVESTGKQPEHPQYGITYSGVKVQRGIVSTIAADLNLFPIGTVLYIPGYGYGVVADIGGAVKGRVIDLYFPSLEAVFSEWGKRTVQVTVIEEGDGKLDEKRLRELEVLFRERSAPPSKL